MINVLESIGNQATLYQSISLHYKFISLLFTFEQNLVAGSPTYLMEKGRNSKDRQKKKSNNDKII